jgi:hypothetical protein
MKSSFTARIINTVVVAREGVNFGQRRTKGENQCDLEVVKRIDPVGRRLDSGPSSGLNAL